jgi:hypothetical protein
MGEVTACLIRVPTEVVKQRTQVIFIWIGSDWSGSVTALSAGIAQRPHTCCSTSAVHHRRCEQFVSRIQLDRFTRNTVFCHPISTVGIFEAARRLLLW